MKSTTGIKKRTSKIKQTKPSKYRFWLVLSCAGLVGLWYVVTIFLFLAVNPLTNSFTFEAAPLVYEIVTSMSFVISVFIASFLCVPLASTLFKRLNIEAPAVSAVAFFMALAFGFNLSGTILGLASFEPVLVSIISMASFLIAGLFYGFVIRPLKHKLSTENFLIVVIGLALLPIVLFIIYRFLLT